MPIGDMLNPSPATMDTPGIQPIGLSPELSAPPEMEGMAGMSVPPSTEPEIRGNVIDWSGGKPIDLNKKLKSGKTVREELSAHLSDVLDTELKNQSKLLENLKRWHRLYKAERRGDRPKPWMADISIPLARKISDTIYVRIMDMVFNKRKIALFKPKSGQQVSAEKSDEIKKQESAFNSYLLNDLNLKAKMVFPTRQAVNTGTGLVKIVHETKNKTIYRYASEDEKGNPAVDKYRLPGTNTPAVKEPSIVFRGPNVYPLDRAKFVISHDALTLDDAYLLGFSFDKRKSQLKTLAAKGIYDQDAVDKLTAGKISDIQEQRNASSGVGAETVTYTEPYTLWELWLSYDVDDDGEEDDIVVTFHPESKGIAKAIYNPIFYSYRPFVDFKGASQVEYTYDGEGICGIVEGICDEIDALHNLMLDRMKLINLPIRLYQTGVGIESKDLEPGKDIPVDVDPTTAMYTVPDSNQTFVIMQDVQFLIAQALEVCGVTQSSLGISTAERPVAKETMVLQEESNKKFKNWTDNFRQSYKELFYKILESFSQYQPEYSYVDEGGAVVSVPMPSGNIRDYLDVDLEVSSETMNQEVRRQIEIMKYQLLTDYITKLAGMAQQMSSPMVPSEFKKFLLYINDLGARAITRIMQNFDETEADAMTADLRKAMDMSKCLIESADMIAKAQQAGVSEGQPGGGQPGQPGQQPGPTPNQEQAIGV